MSIKILNGRHLEGVTLTSTSQLPSECFDITYQGCVLELFERNGRDDSDFIAIVWDEESQQTREVEYASTRGWTYLNNAWVDATPEVRAKADEYWRRITRATFESAARARAKQPQKGSQVRVARGRKVPRGFEGRVIALEQQRSVFSRKGAAETWALIANDSASWKLPARHLDVIQTDEQIEARVAAELAAFDRRYEPPSSYLAASSSLMASAFRNLLAA